MKKAFLFILCLTLFAVSTAAAQDKKDNVQPVDTLPSGQDGMLRVVFADNSSMLIPAVREKSREGSRAALREDIAMTDVYANNWDTVNLFVYRNIALKDLPDEIDIKLIDDLDQYHCPANGGVISKYGPRGRRNHSGTDIKVQQGDPIYAAFDGVVRHSGWNSGGYGHLIIIRHPNGLETYYGHLSRRNVKAGDTVRAGDVIGLGGQTGRAYGTHLHFETRYCDQTFDPEYLINFETGNLRFQTFALEKGYFNIRSRATEGLEDTSDDIDMGALLAAAERNGDSVSDTIMASIEKREREEAAKKEEKYHTIRSGDTLLAIARRYGTTVPEICKMNGIARDATLKIGRSLRIQ